MDKNLGYSNLTNNNYYNWRNLEITKGELLLSLFLCFYFVYIYGSFSTMVYLL